MTLAPSHIVIVTLENESFSEVIGNSAAPFLNQLVSEGMLFTNYDAIAHPSQPNYLALFSGSTQGVTTDTIPSTFPSSVPTLASALAAKGYTFAGYAESGADPGHIPWLDFANSKGDALNFSAFPTTAAGFANLPTVSLVTPANADNMTPAGDGGGGIAAGDQWLQTNLAAYATWAQANNSLLVITFDENDDDPTATYPNQVATIVVGAGVPAGVTNNSPADHYSLLATVESLYGLGSIGVSGGAPPLDFYSSTPPTATTTVTASFSGISDPTNTPPENALAVGPTAIVMAETSRYEVTNLNGVVNAAATGNGSLYSLFASLGSTLDNALLDARAAYDASTGRFVLIAENFQPGGGNFRTNIDIAVSNDSNPADGWSLAAIDTSTGGTTQSDMPYLSAGGGNIYLSSPEYLDAGGSGGSGEWVISEGAVTGSTTITPSASNTASNAYGTMRNAAGANGVTFYVGAYSNGSQSILGYQTYSASAGFSGVQSIAVGDSDVGPRGNDYTAQQQGTSLTLDIGDSRIQSLAYAGGYLWGVSEVMPSGAAAPEILWFKLDVSNPAAPVVVLQGEISGAAIGTGVAVFNPSIAVDQNGDVLINFSASGPNMYPSDYYTVLGAGASSFSAPTLYQASNTYFSSGSLNDQRWGTYSTVVADPNNANGFWLSNEYVSTAVNGPSGSPGWWDTVTAQVQVNGSAAAAPTIADAADVNGYVNAANDTAAQALTGTAGANDTMAIYLNGVTTPAYTTQANAGGTWSQSIGVLANGTYSYTATATDAAGNVSTPSSPLVFTVDTIVPAAPTIADASDINGFVNAANDTAAQVLTGTAGASDTIAIYLNGATAAAYTTQANSGGNWSQIVGVLANGSYSYTATATDQAGNVSGPSSTLAFTVITSAAAPSIADAADINGYVNAANDTAAQALTGAAGANDTINVYLNGATTPAYTTQANGGGSWSQTIGVLANGSYSYTATATDLAGNVSALSSPLAFTVDTTMPSAPTIADASDINGYVNAANDSAAQALTGTAGPGDMIAIYLNGATTAAYTTQADAGGNWSQSIGALANGAYSYVTTATDAAGNVSAPSASLGFTVDTTAPAISSIATSGAGITNGSGDLDAGNTVTLTVSFSETVTVNTAGGSPTLTLNDGGVAIYTGGSGTNALTFGYTVLGGQNTADLVVSSFNLNGATIVDSIGNAANLAGATNANPPGTLQIDTTPPTITISTIASNNIINATKAAAGFKISGSTSGAENGQIVTVQIINSANAVVDSYTTTDKSNAWSVSVTSAQATALADGSYTVTANVSDKAGNPAAQATHALTVDEDKSPEPPLLTVSSTSLTVSAGGSVPLGITATPLDSDDRLSVKISGVPSYETITAPSGDNVSKQLQLNGTYTWTINESSSATGTAITGLTLKSNYKGTGHPTATFTITASNITSGETATSATQTVSVTDPPQIASSSSAGSNPLTAAMSTTSHAALNHVAALFDQFVAAGFHRDQAGAGSITPSAPLGAIHDLTFLTHPQH